MSKETMKQTLEAPEQAEGSTHDPLTLTDEDICRVGGFDAADQWAYWFARAIWDLALERMGVQR